jgi:YfiH family protein
MRVDSDAADTALLFALPGGGRALFTTRADGNLSTMRGPGHEHGRRERDRLCETLGLDWLCASRQVHGADVQRVPVVGARATRARSGGEPLAIDADGHATALPGVGAMVLVADCLPVVLGTQGAVAALHAGWRGLAAGVLEQGVRVLRDIGGGDGDDRDDRDDDGEIVALIGPGAGPCCYEVGPEVHAALSETGDASSALDPAAPGAWGAASGTIGLPPRANIDLPAIAAARLTAAGVQRVQQVGGCTICDPRFYSHRREGAAAGRQAGIAWLS